MFDNRLDLYTVVTSTTASTNNQPNSEYDYLSGNMQIYVPTVQPDTYFVRQHELARLDLISNTVYSTPNLWWLLARVNNIIDIENDMFVGQALFVPVLSDYYNFYNQNTKTAAQAFAASNGFYSI